MALLSACPLHGNNISEREINPKQAPVGISVEIDTWRVFYLPYVVVAVITFGLLVAIDLTFYGYA